MHWLRRHALLLSVGDLPAAERFTAMLIDYAGRHALDIWHLYGKGFRGQLFIGRGDADCGFWAPLSTSSVRRSLCNI